MSTGMVFESTAAGGECPPADDYTLQVSRMGRQWIVGQDFNDPSKPKDFVEVTYKVVGVPDEELDEWIGFTFDKRIAKPKRLSDERGGLNRLIRAAMNLPKIDDADKFQPDELEGKKFVATIVPNEGGYPQIESYRPLRNRKATAAAAGGASSGGGRRGKAVEAPAEDDEWPEDDAQ